MVKRNRIFIISTISIILLLIITGSFYKVNKNHQDKLRHAVIDEINFAARKCFYQDNCGTTITLQELYDLKYLEEVSNPITKEIYDHNLTVTIKGNTAIFNG